MADHTRAKRFKLDCHIIYADLTEETSKTELYKESSSTSEAGASSEDRPPPPVPEELEIPQITSTSHGDRIHSENLSWENTRQCLIRAFYDSKIPRDTETCITCKGDIQLTSNHLRCVDCAAHAYFCTEECAGKVHQRDQLCFHKLEVWKTSERKYTSYNPDVYLTRPDHNCGNEQCTRSGIRVFDLKGRPHTVSIVVCSCEKQNVTFMRHQLWASSVESPSVAFHIDLLNWMQFLVLEAKVSLLAICQSIRWKNDLSVSQFNTLYRGIVGESFEQYRHFQYKIRTMEFVSTHLQDNSLCPACPKESGNRFISIDGNFGLVRKRNSGVSYLEPKHGERMFLAEEKVRGTNVKESNIEVPKNVNCSNFQAGTNIRSKNKAANLDITGVFGSCCRHGVPHTFMNIDKGEGLGYSVCVLDKLLEQVRGSEVKLCVLYDIACLLAKHLEVKGESTKYEKISLAVPIFHVYGHMSSCHISYSPRWLSGYGLTDGEEMERLWSYLRRFSLITKEMTPSHRIDLLTDGLLHYKQRKVSEIELSLAKNWDKAHSIIETTKTDLKAAQRKFAIDVSKVDEWIEEEKQCLSSAKETVEPFSKEENYVQLLQTIDSITESLCECDDMDTRRGLSQQLDRLNTEATKFERTLKTERWHKTDHQFKSKKSSAEAKRKQHILRQLHKQSMDYRFILNLKGKYSSIEGQAIANRLTRNLLRAGKGIKKSINQYNKSSFTNRAGKLPDEVSWSDVCDPLADIYKQLDYGNQTTTEDGQLPSSERDRLIDTRNRNKRAEEEVRITEGEMICVLQSLAKEYNSIVNAIDSNPGEQIGVLIALREKSLKIKSHYFRCHCIFTRYIRTPEIPSMLLSSVPIDIPLSTLQEEMDATEMDDPDEESDEEM